MHILSLRQRELVEHFDHGCARMTCAPQKDPSNYREKGIHRRKQNHGETAQRVSPVFGVDTRETTDTGNPEGGPAMADGSWS